MMPGPWFFLPLFVMGTTVDQPPEPQPTDRVGAFSTQQCIAAPSEIADANSPAFSPDGTQLAVVVNKGNKSHIEIVDIEGGKRRSLTNSKAQDRDPVWLPDGSEIVFSSNRDGRFQIWSVPVSGGQPTKLTNDSGDARRPSVAPIKFIMNGLQTEMCGGPYAQEIAKYYKIIYENISKKSIAVRFVSHNGAYGGLVADSCRAPSFSSDGLSMVMLCGKEVRIQAGDKLTTLQAAEVYHKGVEGGAYPDIDTLQAIRDEYESQLDDSEEGAAGKAGDKRKQASAAYYARLPKRFVDYGDNHFTATVEPGTRAIMSFNQMLVWLWGEGQQARVLDRTSGSNPTAQGAFDGTELAFSPDGKKAAWVVQKSGKSKVVIADYTCPLAELRDLVQYPELWQDGLPASLVANGFVALKSKDKEFFHLYEKARYRERGILITPDALLQAFSDIFSRSLQQREKSLAAELQQFTKLALNGALGLKGPTGLYVQTLFAVPTVLLDVGIPRFAAHQLDQPVWDEPQVKNDVPVGPVAKEQLDSAIAALPTTELQAEVRKALAMLEKQELTELTVAGTKYMVDLSLAKPRGHYVSGGYREYFLAVSWLSQMPFPLDEQGVAAAALLEADSGAVKARKSVEAVTGALAGRAALPGLEHLVKAFPKGKAPAGHSVENAEKAVGNIFGPIRFRSPTAALLRPNSVEVRVLPPRLVLDTEVFKYLTHPSVQMRGIPSALDLFAAMGIPGVVELIVPAEGEEWTLDEYKRNLPSAVKAAGAEKDTDTLYMSWIRLVADLASFRPDTVGRFPGFMKSDAYRYRLLQTALAGFAQVKHHLVLYSAQDMAVECDGDSLITLLYETPERPAPAVWVEPIPKFFEALASMARETGRRFYPEAAHDPGPPESDEGIVQGSLEWYFPGSYDGPGDAERLARALDFLAKAAHKRLKGEELTREEADKLYIIGGHLEAFMIGFQPYGQYGTGADQGRNERGVTLVVDLLFNPQRNQVLHNGVGMPYEIFAAVPHNGAMGVVMGGILSWFEFLSDKRMTDEEWWDVVKAGHTPAPAPWACSFIECHAPPK